MDDCQHAVIGEVLWSIIVCVFPQARINSLSGHVDKLKQQLEEARESEEEKEAEVRQLEGEVRQLQRALEQAETRERTLTQEVTGVRRIHNVNVCD